MGEFVYFPLMFVARVGFHDRRRFSVGPMRVDGNMSDAPNYFPNSFSGPQPAESSHATWHADEATGSVGRHATGDEDNFSQARCVPLFVKALSNLKGWRTMGEFHLTKSLTWAQRRCHIIWFPRMSFE